MSGSPCTLQIQSRWQPSIVERIVVSVNGEIDIVMSGKRFTANADGKVLRSVRLLGLNGVLMECSMTQKSFVYKSLAVAPFDRENFSKLTKQFPNILVQAENK